MSGEAVTGNNSCYRCGRQNHLLSIYCPFKSAKCHNCGKQGHIQPVCRKPKQSPPPNKGGRGTQHSGARGQGQPVRTVQEEQTDSDISLIHITALNKVDSKARQPYLVHLKLDGKPFKMEIDTGACMSLISEEAFKQLYPGRSLKPSSAHLATYSGQPITALGEINVVVTYNAQQATLPLIVVTGTGPSLFGRNWLTTICLDWKSIGTVSDKTALTQLLEKYWDIFEEGLGKLIGHEAKIHVDPNAQPHFYKARTLPYALRSKVEEELERLEREGVI